MKIIVAHPYQQHSYRTAYGLQLNGMLFKYITTNYYKKGTITHFATNLLRKKIKERAKNRCLEGLDERNIIIKNEFLSLIRLFFQNFGPLKKHHDFIRYLLADRFAIKVAKYAIKHKVDAVITYDDCSPVLFGILKNKAPWIKRILDVSAGNREYMRGIYQNDFHLAPLFADLLKHEVNQCFDIKKIERCKQEFEYSQYFLCASNFPKKTLLKIGIPKNKIFLCPYGVDSKLFTFNERKAFTLPLQFVFVGGTKELKGIYYLLEAFKGIDDKEGQLHIIGYNTLPSYIQKNYSNVFFDGFIPHSKLPSLLGKYDIFIMPSLGEGLSLSAIEASSCGLPLLVSENSGINDWIVNGLNGFVFNIQDSEAIKNRVEWAIKHIEILPSMSIESKRISDILTWENYYTNISKILEEIVLNV